MRTPLEVSTFLTYLMDKERNEGVEGRTMSTKQARSKRDLVSLKFTPEFLTGHVSDTGFCF